MRKKKNPTLGQVLDMIIELYKMAEKNKNIKKPLANAVYHTWRWVDAVEEPRGITDDNES